MSYSDSMNPDKNEHFFTQLQWELQSLVSCFKGAKLGKEMETRLFHKMVISMKHRMQGMEESLEAAN